MRSVLFTIGRLEFVGSGKFLAGGRNCRDELRRGDRLKLKNGCDGEQIELLVDEITAYDRQVTEVGRGMTAGLLFNIDLAPHFRLGSELYGEMG